MSGIMLSAFTNLYRTIQYTPKVSRMIRPIRNYSKHLGSSSLSIELLGSSSLSKYASTQNNQHSSQQDISIKSFALRHIGPSIKEESAMLKELGCTSLDDMTWKIVPHSIVRKYPLKIGDALTENQALNRLRAFAQENKCDVISLLGTGFYGTNTPPVILRNVLENPDWYSPYTPYQAEISQGRLRALLIYQTMITDLTNMDISNASLLDESTAAAEAMSLAYNSHKRKKNTFLVSDKCHPQTLAVLQTRAESLGIDLKIVDIHHADLNKEDIFGLVVQYPATDGVIHDYTSLVKKAKEKDIITICSADLLALTLIKPPGEMGFDIAVGSAQRFGVQPGFGGPAAAYIATKDKFKRMLPGRIVGVSKDVQGNEALRMALQTREQHIKREKATSNICTAQALLANISGFYAVYHGPDGITEIANDVHDKAKKLADILRTMGYNVNSQPFFDTIKVITNDELETFKIKEFMESSGINIRNLDGVSFTMSLDESITDENFSNIIQKFSEFKGECVINYEQNGVHNPLEGFERKTTFLQHPVFNQNRSETNMMRFLKDLSSKDIGLADSMIPLGSCTMKLNSAAGMVPVTWNEISSIHPFAPSYQTEGYVKMFRDLERDLADITGFTTVSLQPNAGSQGEYTGLKIISKYHKEQGQEDRDVCFIPSSAHGTNPASARIAGMKVVTIRVDEDSGQIDTQDLFEKCQKYKSNLSAIMITYPSTYGIYDENIREICDMVHNHGGQVYLDGANMNAQVGITSPGDIGADVCHLNLHKTFTCPHGGGGPGLGPVCVASHLVPYLPTHPLVKINGTDDEKTIGCVSSSPWGSASILSIVWMYIKMMGDSGLKKASQVAMLNANYMAKKLEPHYKIMYRGKNGFVAHEFIINLKEFSSIGITEDDIAKRLMDFNFHAPTMSWPIPRTLMIEPTESESKDEIDKYITAMICIRGEIKDIQEGKIVLKDSPLKNAPHTQEVCTANDWDRKYTREQAVYPLSYLRNKKIWASVSRIDHIYGEKNLFCSCG